eukprot:5910137-Pleurochrysis_carterae.AAC.1
MPIGCLSVRSTCGAPGSKRAAGQVLYPANLPGMWVSSHGHPHTLRYMRYYLPTPLCARRVYVWAPSKLVTKLDDSSATFRSWTDGRLASLRGKTLVTSPLVTFTQAWH